jgi:hypothetical protein
MKKILISFAIALILLSSFLVLSPKVAAQTTDDIKVLNYSYHLDFSGGSPLLVVVGEVKNEGSTSYQTKPIAGIIYATDGSVQAQSQGYVNTLYLVPGQKMPFEITFNSPKTSADGTWLTASIDLIDFTPQAISTNTYPSAELKIISPADSIDTTSTARGTYWVTGKVQNTGSQTAEKIFVIATFYNSSGTTVAFGYSDSFNLTASSTASFKLGAFDLNMSQTTPQQKITSYSLVVIPKAPLLTGPPFPDPSAYGIVADSAASSPTSSSSDGTSINTKSFDYTWLIYAAIIVVIIAAVAITIIRLPKRHSGTKKVKQRSGSSQTASSKKPQGKVRYLTVPLFKYFLRHWVCL